MTTTVEALRCSLAKVERGKPEKRMGYCYTVNSCAWLNMFSLGQFPLHCWVYTQNREWMICHLKMALWLDRRQGWEDRWLGCNRGGSEQWKGQSKVKGRWLWAWEFMSSSGNVLTRLWWRDLRTGWVQLTSLEPVESLGVMIEIVPQNYF